MKGNKTSQHIAALFIFFAGWMLLAYCSGIFHGFFQLTDDVMYAGLLEKLQHRNFIAVLKDIISDDLSIRFRPVALSYYLFIAAIFKLNYGNIILLNISIAALSCFFFYRFARNISLSFGTSLLLCAILYMGNQGTVAVRTVLSENPAMLFLSLSLFFMSKERNVTNRSLQLIFFALAAGTKESFILLAPAMIWGDLLLQKNASFSDYLRNNRTWVSALMLITLSAVVLILLKPGTNAIGYAGVDKDSFVIENLISAAYNLLISKGYFLSLIAFFLLIYEKEADEIRKNMKPVITLLLLITIPQILLFSKSKIFMHYLMPGMLWSAIAGGLAWQFSGSHVRKGILQLIAKAPIILLLLFNSFLFIKNCLIIGDTGRSIRETLYMASANTGPQDSIVIIGHPLFDAEKAVDAKAFLHSYLFNKASVILPSYTDTLNIYLKEDREFITTFIRNTAADYHNRQRIFSNHPAVIFMPRTYDLAAKEYADLLRGYSIKDIGSFKVAVKP